MESLDISRSEGKVFFGQLLGMCDQLTFPLGQAGYPAYKVSAIHEFFPELLFSVCAIWTSRRCFTLLVQKSEGKLRNHGRRKGETK